MSRDTHPKALLPYLSDLVKLALSSGASGAEFLHTELVERSFQTRGANPGPLTEKEKRNLHGLIFLANGASASFAINADLKGRHPASIQKASERAKKSAGDPFAGPADRLDIKERGKGLKDPRYPYIDQDALQELVEINQQDGSKPHIIRYKDLSLIHI